MIVKLCLPNRTSSLLLLVRPLTLELRCLQVRLLTDAVDDITTIDDFLAVSEGHILEDVNKCVLALQESDADTLDRTAGAIRGRAARVCNVVGAEMDNYEPCAYTERVLEAVKVLREQGTTVGGVVCRLVFMGGNDVARG